MKFALFGWFNKRLIQTEEDKDFIRKRLIDSDFDLTNSNGFTAIIIPIILGFLLEFGGSIGFCKSW